MGERLLRITRLLLHWLMLCLLLLSLAVAAAFTPAGRPLVLRLAIVIANSAGLPFHVSATGLGPGWPQRIELAELTLSDQQGPWLVITHPVLQWELQSLRSNHIVMPRLQADHVTLLRSPQLAASANASSPAASDFGFDLADLSIEGINLPGAPPLSQLQSSLNMQNGILTLNLAHVALPAHSGNMAGTIIYNVQNGTGQLKASGTSTPSGPFALEATLDADTAASSRITISQLNAEPQGTPLTLIEPAHIRIASNEVAIDSFKLSYGPALLKGMANLQAEHLQAELGWQNLHIPKLELVESTQGQLQLAGSLSQPVLTGQIEATATSPLPARLKAEFNYAGHTLTSKVAVQSNGRQLLDGSINVQDMPMLFALTPAALETARVNGRLSGSFPLDWLARQEIITLPPLKGTASLNAQLDGTVRNPTFSGRINLSDVAYDDLASGMRLRSGSLVAVADGQNITIEKISATDSGSGRLTGSGEYKSSQLTLALQLSNFRLLALDLAKTRATGPLSFAGNADNGLNLSGQLKLTDASIHIPERLPENIAHVPVTERGTAPRQREIQRAGSAQSALALGLNLTLDIPGPLGLSGRGLQASFGKGSLQVSGNTLNPAISGNIDLLRGQYDFLGKRLRLGEGSLRFDGGAVDDPALDLNANYSSPSITATVNIGGRTSNPEISLSSTPALPQDEIISRILFGKTSSSLSPLQVLQLGQAIKGLLAGDGGFDPLARVRTGIGLDQLDVTGGDGDAANSSAIEIGKSIGSDVYINTRQNLSGQGSTVGIEVKISPEISIHSDSSDSSPANIQLRYQRDY